MRLHLMKFNNKQALRFCTWENIMQEHRLGFPWGAALWRGPEDPGGQAAQWEWTVLLLKCQRKPVGRTSPAERRKDRSHYPTNIPALSSTWKVLLFQAIPAILDSVLVPAIFIKKKKKGGEKMWTGWRGSTEGSQRWSKDWEACPMRKCWENWVCSALEKRLLRGDHIITFQ